MVADAGSTLDARLRFAIDHKRLLRLTYHDQPRIAEPHDYGAMKGVDKLFVFQLRNLAPRPGKTSSIWRLLDVAKIGDCVVLDETFPGSRGTSQQRHHVWDVIYARVKS